MSALQCMGKFSRHTLHTSGTRSKVTHARLGTRCTSSGMAAETITLWQCIESGLCSLCLRYFPNSGAPVR